MSACAAGQIGKYIGASRVQECILCEPDYYCKGDGTQLECPAGYWCEEGTVDFIQNRMDDNYVIKYPGVNPGDPD